MRSRSRECNRFPRFITPRSEPRISFPDASVHRVRDHTERTVVLAKLLTPRAGLHPFLVKRPSVRSASAPRDPPIRKRGAVVAPLVEISHRTALVHDRETTITDDTPSKPCWERGLNICLRRQSIFFPCIDPAWSPYRRRRRRCSSFCFSRRSVLLSLSLPFSLFLSTESLGLSPFVNRELSSACDASSTTSPVSVVVSRVSSRVQLVLATVSRSYRGFNQRTYRRPSDIIFPEDTSRR